MQKIQDNPQLFRTTYYGHHTCKAFPRVSQIILDSPLDGNPNYISFDQNPTTFPSIKQEEVFSFYPKIEDQIQSSSSDYLLPNDHDHLTFEASCGHMQSPDVMSSGVSTTTTTSNDNLEIGIDFEECLWNFEGCS